MPDRKWHYPQKGEYPVIYGEYEHKHYPQIPCLVFYHGMYGVRFWNCTEECWDDEECDDFYCSKEEVGKWMYIDSLEEEQPSGDLEKEIQDHITNVFWDMEGIAYMGATAYATVEDMEYLARHFYEFGRQSKEAEINRLDTEIEERLERIAQKGLENAHSIDFTKQAENSIKILKKRDEKDQ